MVSKTPKADKQLMAEKIWLLYFNDVLYRNGTITREAYHRMIHKINSRTKTVDKKSDPVTRKRK